MAEIGRRYNPNEKKPKNTGKKKMDKILNILIGIVVVLILVVAAFIVIGGSDSKDSANDKVAKTTQQDNEKQNENIVEQDTKEQEKEKARKAEEAKTNEQDQTQSENNSDTNSTTENTSVESNNVTSEADGNSNSTTTNTTDSSYNYEESETATTETSKDANVLKVVTDSSWKPTKTSQKDKGSSHTSSYTKGSIDWNEKITTIANTTGLAEKDMIVWYVKNGGSPDTSVGIVSSKDKEKSYRVSMKWIPEEGWQTTKLEVLKTYKGAY